MARPGDGGQYKKATVILTSNHGFADWSQVFANPLVATIIDRLLHDATVLNIRGRSYRMRAHQDRRRGRTAGESRLHSCVVDRARLQELLEDERRHLPGGGEPHNHVVVATDSEDVWENPRFVSLLLASDARAFDWSRSPEFSRAEVSRSPANQPFDTRHYTAAE